MPAAPSAARWSAPPRSCVVRAAQPRRARPRHARPRPPRAPPRRPRHRQDNARGLRCAVPRSAGCATTRGQAAPGEQKGSSTYIHTGETSAPRRGLAASFRAAAPVGPPGHDLALEVEASGHTHRPWKACQAVASARARRPGVARGHTGTYLTGEVCHGAQMRHTLSWQLSEEPPPTPQSPSTSGPRPPYLPILIQMLIGI